MLKPLMCSHEFNLSVRASGLSIILRHRASKDESQAEFLVVGFSIFVLIITKYSVVHCAVAQICIYMYAMLRFTGRLCCALFPP